MVRRLAQQGLERGGIESGARGDPNDFPRREHGLRAKFHFEPGRVLGEVAVVQPHHFGVRSGTFRERLRQRGRPLRNEAGVGSVNERRPAGRIGRIEESLNGMGLIGDHGAQSPVHRGTPCCPRPPYVVAR
ncbi:MAG: hypothetical protein A49_02180 [Methyloceanibacter sp.]|nr:MAG: hypothetical protein A49_02180 [Methyloceanibacter sp.]